MIQNFLFRAVYLLISDFLVVSPSQQKLATKITHFTRQFRLKNVILQTSTHSTLKKYTPATQPKTLLTLENLCLVGVR